MLWNNYSIYSCLLVNQKGFVVMFTINPLFFIFSLLPLLFYLLDGYYENNIRKGIYMILGFIFIMFITTLTIEAIHWHIIFIVPLFFFLLVFVKYLSKKETK